MRAKVARCGAEGAARRVMNFVRCNSDKRSSGGSSSFALSASSWWVMPEAMTAIFKPLFLIIERILFLPIIEHPRPGTRVLGMRSESEVVREEEGTLKCVQIPLEFGIYGKRDAGPTRN